MTDIWYLRNPEATIVAHSENLICVPPTGVAVRLRRNLELVRNILTLLREPKTADELSATLSFSSAELERLLGLLVRERIILCGSGPDIQSVLSPAREHTSRLPLCKRLVVGVCGTIYASLVLSLILSLKRTFTEELDVILTDAATKFVRPQAF